MIAAVSTHSDLVERLLGMGSNIYLKSSNDFTALDWAKRFNKFETVELIESYQ